MVKDELKTKEVKEYPEVTLTTKQPLAKTYYHGDPFEQVTQPDVSPSLTQMVSTGLVGNFSNKYEFGEHDDDDHDFPDMQKIANDDKAVREMYLNDINNQANEEYENLNKKEDEKDNKTVQTEVQKETSEQQ